MTQRDKVKELVGRGLNSYHTKSLQQIDRIEKKNKEQNHKISILSNELDNDYLTKTEEGSVVSLEHSKEGMIYLDELQGNTLVNYCTDGSKEMTLNGDIDVEGTFVTTTEGVDGGKVDVLCEGNTMVNLAKNGKEQKDNINWKAEYPLNAIKNSTVYTVVFEICNIVNPDGIQTMETSIENQANYGMYQVRFTNGIHKSLITTRTNSETSRPNLDVNQSVYFCTWIINKNQPKQTTYSIRNVIVLEGDWTNKEIPSEYFEGMTSVGQDDENGHKIEILSQNTIKITDYFYGTQSNGSNANNPNWTSLFFKCKPNTTYTVEKLEESNRFGIEQCFYNGEGKSTTGNTELSSYADNSQIKTFTTKDTSHGDYIKVYLSNQQHKQFNVFITESGGDVDSLNYKSNKKEILLNEPLRGLPNGIKDRFVKIGGKFYIERNCRGKIITKDTTKFNLSHVTTTTNLGIGLVINKTLELADCFRTAADNFLLEGFVNGKSGQWYEKHWGAYSNSMNIVAVFPPTYTLDQMMDFIDGKQIIYKLETPIYEPLEINPELITYLDTTHISNNSIIPCNMKIQNSGYNAIIKPSTLYTVAIDTNKSGTIGMNLGGAKGTTTNNVLTLTTPATLSDDSLRLYGKDIKGSKVRLLEGDKTNWIPSHFEGMKSSFEDKVQSDGTYKMEILSNNQNLFDRDKTYYRAGWGEQNYQKYKNGFSFCSKNGWNSIGYTFESLKNKTVTVCATVTCVNKDASKQQEQHFSIIPVEYGYPTSVIFRDGETKKVKFNITLKDNGRVYFIGASNNEGSNEGGIQWFLEDISVVEGIENDYVPRECNKIQFSSIEPLRSVGDIKDRFVFKDSKLMIERNCRQAEGAELVYARVHQPAYTDRFAIQASLNDCVKDHAKEGIIKCNKLPHKSNGFDVNYDCISSHKSNNGVYINLNKNMWGYNGSNGREILERYIRENNIILTVQKTEPIYEEIPFELQKIILEGYENGTLFIDTIIPPTVSTTYSGETPIVKSVKLNKTEVLNNTTDINDNIIPYLMDMDYRVVCLELATETQGISMARLFGGVYEMLKRDILSRRYSVDEYRHRLDAYLGANKITHEEYTKLGDMLND